MHQRRYRELLDLHVAVVALDDERTGLAFVRVIRDGGEAVDRDFIEDFDAVVDYRQGAAHEADIVALPLAGGFAGVNGRRDPAVKGACAMRVRRTAVVVQNLDLVTAAESDSAIRMLDDSKIDMRLEIPEFLVGDNVSGGRGVA